MGTSGVIELLQALRTFHDSFIHNTIMMMYTDAISADIIVSVGRYFNLQALQEGGSPDRCAAGGSTFVVWWGRKDK